MNSYIIWPIVAGVSATFVMDVWQILLKSIAKIPTTDWKLVARWVGYIFKGRIIHKDINCTPAIGNETSYGWLIHYSVGIIYAILFFIIVQTNSFLTAGFFTSIIFSLLTLVFPWFVLQPAIGMGVLALRTPKPKLVIAYNFLSHFMFGVGLYLGVVIIKLILN